MLRVLRFLAVVPLARLNAWSIACIVMVALVTTIASQPAWAASQEYVVTTTDDIGDGVCDGSCTLREAIEAANANAGADVIEFNIPGSPPFTIRPGSALPEITEPVTIDGTSQPGFAGAPIIELDGSNAGPDAWSW